MMDILLDTAGDIEWLFDTTLKQFKQWRKKTKSAEIRGFSEDNPSYVALFASKSPLVTDKPIAVFEADHDGDLQHIKSNPAKKKATRKAKPRTAAQKAATARMLAANKHKRIAEQGKHFGLRNIAKVGKVPRMVKHVRTAAQKKARKQANTVPGYYPNPSYRGKYPRNIRSVASIAGMRGVMSVHTNDGQQYMITAKDTNGIAPRPGESIDKWPHSSAAALHELIGIKRNSTSAQQRATKRRRGLKAADIADKWQAHQGKYLVFAFDPKSATRHKYFVAAFEQREKAFEYAHAYNKAHGVRVTVET